MRIADADFNGLGYKKKNQISGFIKGERPIRKEQVLVKDDEGNSMIGRVVSVWPGETEKYGWLTDIEVDRDSWKSGS